MQSKRVNKWLAWGAVSLTALGVGAAIKSLMPPRFNMQLLPAGESGTEKQQWDQQLPDVDVHILRCGSVFWPELVMVRGSLSLKPRKIAYSSVLIRHPQGTFLYDTGLSGDIYQHLKDQPLTFRQTLARFKVEQTLSGALHEQGLKPEDLDFVLLSHLHWDHVSGVPDIVGVPLRVNRVEFDAAKQGVIPLHKGLVWRLMEGSPLTCFDLEGPSYEGFRSSLDVFGDGSIVLVPLPGHTPGNTGMFINRANGARLFFLGDAAHVAENYLYPTTPHPFFWNGVTSDKATALQTLLELHHFARSHPEVPLIAMHDARMQEASMQVENERLARI
ncbi:MBL fold metallo-hydrolase [Ktedonobacter robiniae]|uniref:MBL fold metallo-hydrolase n=1 Tax=Ktedonobacter robiniae TaxID=2778365 RepID=A0ABQ3UIG5_9CHLR|nr:MBL fold metallo-hydrolase [Ktedonobacter robiniae]GHO52493.1 MBL fold metallo-hydrolase [Ktedonobacter robiniae]